MVAWAHPSPQPKRHLDGFSRSLLQRSVTITDPQTATDRPTDYATRSVTLDRMYTYVVRAMHPQNTVTGRIARRTKADSPGLGLLQLVRIFRFFTARRIASGVLATAILPVRPSVRPSHAGIVSKRRHVARCSFHRWIAKCV